MSRETQLWYWFVFQSGLPTLRAKELLLNRLDEGRTLEEVMDALPHDAARLGLSAREARALRPPETLPRVVALRWNEAAYPRGLHRLPLKLRPALLFAEGSTALLERPIVYLPPASIAAEERETVREVLSLLLGESLLPAAVHGSDQAALLVEEMAYAEGETLLFVRAGVDAVELREGERTLLAQERLLLISPLPPGASYKPEWDVVLQEVEAATARRFLLTGIRPTVPRFLADHAELPALWFHPGAGRASVPGHVEHAGDVAAALLWLSGDKAGSDTSTAASASLASMAARPLGAEPPADPPPTPEETLRILQQGGAVPPVLRRRLLGDQEDDA
ncbi:MAG: hypothetical protein ACP5HM_13380 [Anaerolineae bacterium]